MKNITLFAVFVLLTYWRAAGEVYPIYDLATLCVSADRIVSAKFLSQTGNTCLFLAEDLLKKERKQDTLILKNIAQLFIRTGPQAQVNFAQSEELILFLVPVSTGWHPILSGIRLLQGGTIHSPDRHSDIDDFFFAPIREDIDWNELKTRIRRVNKRIARVERLLGKKKPVARNRALFRWIARNESTFGAICGSNADCGWGGLPRTAFRRITEAGIPADTWRAGAVYRRSGLQSMSGGRRSSAPLYDYGIPSFRTEKDIQFLLTRITAENPIADRIQALVFLGKASSVLSDDELAEAENISVTVRLQRQKKLREQLLPLLWDDKAKAQAFQVITALTKPIGFSFEYELEPELLTYLANRYASEPPSAYRSSMAEFIVRHSSEQAWRELSGNDARIWVTINLLTIVRRQQELLLTISCDYGTEPLVSPLRIEFSGVTSGENLVLSPKQEMLSPLAPRRGRHRLQIDISTLPPGEYEVVVHGRAGEDGRLSWTSEVGFIEF